MALAVACIWSVSRPLRFDQERQKREEAVKERLLAIRSAEERYCAQHGEYAADFATLIAAGLLADSSQYIPYSGGERFDLITSARITPSGKVVPLMQVAPNIANISRGLTTTAWAT